MELFIKEEYLLYLDNIKDFGITDMSTTTPYLIESFNELDLSNVLIVLNHWIKTYSERHPSCIVNTRRIK